MARYRLTPRAEQDLRDIWRSIAVDNESAVDRLVRRIFDRLDLAASQQQMGRARPELSETARTLVEGRYVIIYEPASDGVLVVAVVHRMRDPENWLK